MRKAGVQLRRNFDIVRCSKCGHVYVDPRVSDEALSLLYDERYYKGEGFDRTIDYAGPPSAYKRSEVSAVCETIKAATGDLRRLRWLDFGCGAGYLLEALLENCVEALGFDDSPAAWRRCKEKQLPVATQPEIEALAGTFDVVSAVEVIEHVPDPRSFLRYLRSFLKPGGLAYVQTGNWNVVSKLPKTPYIMPEGHIHYFTPLELKRLFFEVGLSCAPTFNRSWFPWRDVPPKVRRFVPLAAYESLASIVAGVAPGYAPFPLGVRTA